MTDWLHTIDTCPSTNRIALNRACDLYHGDAIFTRNQTAGRGQRNRVWHSPAGVLTVSFVMQLLTPEQIALLSFSAGLAIIARITRPARILFIVTLSSQMVAEMGFEPTTCAL